MTVEIKRKIIWWIKRILNYSECSDRGQYIVIERRKIQLLQSRQHYTSRDVQAMSDDQLKYFANTQLISELEKNKMISYEREVNGNEMIFTAKLRVVV